MELIKVSRRILVAELEMKNLAIMLCLSDMVAGLVLLSLEFFTCLFLNFLWLVFIVLILLGFIFYD